MMEMPAWFVELRLEAEHAWALELNEMPAAVRDLWLEVDSQTRRLMRTRLLYGYDGIRVLR